MIPRLLALALVAATGAAPAPTATAVFAGGCFWSTESAMEKVPGVISAVSGYTGGTVVNPTYEQVSGQRTGHYEAVRVTYDPRRIDYARLLDRFHRTIDPGDAGGTFCDRGPEYRTAVFVASEAQRRAAVAAHERLAQSGVLKGRPVATRILRAQVFYPAEGYHQDYARLNPVRYEAYRVGCRREARLRAVWGSAAGERA